MENAINQEKRLAGIDSELEDALRAYRGAAADLHGKRAVRARALSDGVTALMQELGMEGGRFEFEVRHDPSCAPSARGDDRIDLRVSANPGVEPGPLRKVASGGELSRISLAVKIIARERHDDTTQVFDEVDAGIGGTTATTVGSLIARLASRGQALCVTHLAQVAVFAREQLQVTKSAGRSGALVEVGLLESEGRIDEIARMLGGQLSTQSRAHAEELLREAAAPRH